MHRNTPVSCIAVCLILLVLPRCGGESSETVCEFQDANLLFPNAPAGSAGDIKAKTWNKENGIRVASWMEKTNFEPNKLYGDRLMAIGENSIKIQNATRFDSGVYTLVLTSGSTQQFIEFTLHLEVLVPPTNQCIPNITQEVNALKADLPPDVCGIPMLTTKWTQKNVNIRVLSFESGLVPGMYTACAFGKSLDCFKGDVYKLCSNYTVSASQPQNENSVPVGGIIAGIIIAVIGVIICFVYWKFIRRKYCMSTKGQTIWYIHEEEDALIGGETPEKESAAAELCNSNKENSLTEEETLAKGLQDIKRHLINKYRTMTAVPLSPSYEENFVDVSEVYCDLDIISLRVEDDEGTERINPQVASYKEILCADDKAKGISVSVRPIPAVILGECGSGKSCWCKNLVHQWCQYHENNQVHLKDNNSSVPEVAKFDILLYITLKNKPEGVPFMEYVKNKLFVSATDYFECINCCISQHTASVLLLIDGFDEVTCSLEPSFNLLWEKELFQCSIVITSRSSGLECLQQKVVRTFQIQGLSPDRSKEYANKCLDILGKRRNEKLNADLFWKFAKHMQVLSMCRIPFLCLSLIMFWIESKALSVDLTDVLLTIIEYYLRHAMTREKFKANICQVLEQQHFDISIYSEKTKSKQYLREHGYLLKVISSVAENLWYLRTQVHTDKNSTENECDTKENGNDIELCVETGILTKMFIERMERKRTHISFPQPLLFEFFVALSVTLGKQDSCTKYMTTAKALVSNSYVIHMLCQVAPNTGQEIIRGISKLKLYDENNKKHTKKKGTKKKSTQLKMCNIQCEDTKLQGGAPVKWLQRLMCTDEASSEKLSILTEGLKFTKNLTVFLLQLHENRNECIFRLPILPMLQGLLVDIDNCTLLLHEEREWNKEHFSKLGKIVLKSVNMDVRTIGYIVEALCSCYDLRTLELCPKDDSDAEIVAENDQKAFKSWGCLANGILSMNKLSVVRLHNLTIGKHLSTLIDSLSRCPVLEILDLLNLKETDTKEILTINKSDRSLFGCVHQEVKLLEKTKSILNSSDNLKAVQLANVTMPEKSWLTFIKLLEIMSPSILHIDRVHQSVVVLNKLFQVISKCINLNILSFCCIYAGIDPTELSGLRALHKLQKLTLCKIMLPDSSWTELSKIISNLIKLKEMSLAHLEMKSLVLNELLQGISKCKNLKILSMCYIHAGSDLVEFSGLRALHKLEKLTICRVTLPDSSWKELSETISGLIKLKEISLAHFEMKNCFLKVHNLTKLKVLQLREIELEETLWSTLGNEIISLPKLKKLELISCKISKKGHLYILDAVKHSSLYIKMTETSDLGDSGMLYLDMVVTSKNTKKTKTAKMTSH